MKNKRKYKKNRYTVLPQVAVLRKFAFEWKSLIANWAELHKLFHFHPHLLRKSQAMLTEIKKSTNCTEFVAVHVRRKDYLKYVTRRFLIATKNLNDFHSSVTWTYRYKNATVAEASFYLAAMDLFRETLATPLAFVIASDDPKWCRINLRSSPDTIVVGNKNRPEADLALLASCNHTIFDYGTYGLTVAMFNFEGRTVVFDTGSAENSVTDQLALKFISWIKLGNSPLSIPEN